MERIRRRWWTAAVTLVALVLVGGAVLTGLFQLVMLIAPGYRENLADYVSHVAGQPVEIGGVGLGWRGLAPRLELTDITLYGQDERSPALSAQRLRLGFGAARLLRGDTTPNRVELSGVELFAQIDGQGRFSLRGLDTSGMPARGTQDWLRQLGRFQNVRLSRCELKLDDARLHGVKPTFRLIDAEISFVDGHGEASAKLSLPPAMGSSVQFVARMQGDLERAETWNGRWTLDVEQLASLPWIDALLAEGATVRFGDTEMKVEGRLEQGQPGAIDLRLDAGAVLGHHQAHSAGLRDIGLVARLAPQAAGWMLDIGRLEVTGAQGPWPVTQARVLYRREPAADPAGRERGPPHVEAEASYLNLADLAPWLALLPDEGLGAEAGRLRGLSGAVRRLILRWDGGRDTATARYSLRADLDELALAPGEQTPGFEGLSGEFSASENGGRLGLRDTPFGLDFPRVFAHTVGFESVSGDLAWTRTGEGWDVQMPKFGWQLDGSRGEGTMRLFVPRGSEGSPRLKLDARFSAIDVTRLKSYAPAFWPDNLREWLRRAVVAGRAPAARLRIDGALADFPFVDKPGTFALDVDAADATLAFAPDWPPVEKLSAHLEFRGNSLSIRGESGSVMGNRVERVLARIPDLHEAQLNITGEVQGDAGRFYDFLRASPLAPRLAGLLTRTKASGDSVVQVELDVPLRHARETQVSGEIQLRGIQLAVEGLPEPVTEVRGQMRFDNHTASAQDLTGQLFGTAVTASLGQEEDQILRLRGGFEFVPHPAGAGASRLLPVFLRQGLEGASQWQAVVPLSGAEVGRVILSSNLQGTAVKLPQPMQKPAEQIWPTRVELSSDSSFPLRVAVEVEERLGVDLAFLRDAGGALLLQRGRVRAGAGPSPHAGEDGLFITGTVTDLDPTAWIAAIRDGGRTGPGDAPPPAAPVLSAELNVGTLWLGAQRIEGLRLSQQPAPGGWLTRLSGNGAQGELGFRNGADGGQITGRFQRVQFAPRRVPDPVAKRSEADRTTGRSRPADPGALPLLDLEVEDLRIGDAELGRLEFRTQRIADGQRIEQLRTAGRGGKVDLRGEWRRAAGRSSADLQFSVESDSIDDLLQGFGYAPSLTARRSRVRGALSWPVLAPGAVDGISLVSGEGYLDMDIEKGVLRAVEPGAGRVLGLINFWALPRRLSLDFGDVLSEGLAFDEIKGRFDMGQGNATTQDLDIEAPSLKMEVRGRVGLVARDYDQRVSVYPDVSAGVTLGALLIGGPAAGVLALIAQQVLDQPLDQVGQLSYRLTGNWDDPKVVREDSGLLPGGVPPSPADARPSSTTVMP